MTDPTRSFATIRAMRTQLNRACGILSRHQLHHEAAKVQQDVREQHARRKAQRLDLGIGRDPAEQRRGA